MATVNPTRFESPVFECWVSVFKALGLVVTKSTNLPFDFADCRGIDSSAVGVLVGLHVSIVRQGGVIGVTNLSTNLKSYLVMAKLITTFKHFNSENEAIVNLRSIGH